MSEKFDKYIVDLKGMTTNELSLHYLLDHSFFSQIEESEMKGGEVSVSLHVQRLEKDFKLDFQFNGEIAVLCNRCLDEMNLPVSLTEMLYVELGKEYNDEDLSRLVISEREGVLNVGWLFYEFLALSIPINHVHDKGLCNEEMMQKLRGMLCVDATDDDLDEEDNENDSSELDLENKERSIDPRWNELKKIVDNN